MAPKLALYGAVAAIATVVIIIIVSIVWVGGTYNELVSMEEDVDASWAQVENQYQRKIDLIPTLIATVEGYKEFEAGTLENVTALRTQWMNADSSEDQMDASNQLDAELVSIILTYENYPYLQAIEAVRDLMVELEGTENRITVERMRYNEDVRDYNKAIRQFPTVIIANSFGFEEAEYFESDAAPDQP